MLTGAKLLLFLFLVFGFSANGKTCVEVLQGRQLYFELKEPNRKGASTFLLIHGLSMDSSAMKFASELEAAGFGVLKVDLLGHGKTLENEGFKEKEELRFEKQVAAVKELILLLDLKGIRIVGHSFGGAVAMKLAEDPQLQKRIERVIGITSYIQRVDHYFREQMVATFRPWKKLYYPWLSDQAFDQMVRSYLEYCTLIYGDAYMYVHYREVISKFFPNDPNLEIKVQAAIAIAEDVVRIDFIQSPPKLGKIPFHLIYSGKDHLIPESQVLEFVERLEANHVKLQVTKLPDSTHLVPIEEPGLIARLLLGN